MSKTAAKAVIRTLVRFYEWRGLNGIVAIAFFHSFCIIPLLTLLYFSEKQEEYLLNCMKIQ